MSDEEETKVEWDATVLPLAKLVLGKKGIEQRQASEVDKKKVDFCRGRDFCDFLVSHEAALRRHCQPALDKYLSGRAPADNEDAEKLGAALVEKNFLVPALYRPLTNTAEDEKERKKKKFWPDRLVRKEGKPGFEFAGYYIIKYEGSQTWRHLALAGVISAIILGCLFPVWPNWARIAAWYVCLIFLTLYILLEISRITFFCGGWLIGIEFWIFPNFNDEYCTFVDTFKPFYSFERRKDGLMMLVSRLVVFAIVALGIEETSKTHSISDVQDFVVGSYQDIIQWGENKALMLDGGQARMSLPNLADLEKEEEEERMREEGLLGAESEDPVIPGMPRTASEPPSEDPGHFEEEKISSEEM